MIEICASLVVVNQKKGYVPLWKTTSKWKSSMIWNSVCKNVPTFKNAASSPFSAIRHILLSLLCARRSRLLVWCCRSCSISPDVPRVCAGGGEDESCLGHRHRKKRCRWLADAFSRTQRLI